MNVTMPAPAPTAPPAAAPNDRVGARERTTTTPSERRADDERTFEEQLDDVAVALASTRHHERAEAHTKPDTASGRTEIVSTAIAAPLASTGPASPTTAGETPADTAVAAATDAPMVTEIEGLPAPLAAATAATTLSAPAAPTSAATTDAPTPAPTDPAATGIVASATIDASTPAPTDPAATGIVASATIDASTPAPTDPAATGVALATPTPATTDPTAAAPGTALPLGSPADTGPIVTAAFGGGADQAPHATSLGAASKLALDAAVDAKTDEVAGVESADTAGVDAPTPPVVVNPTSSLRRNDAPGAPTGGPAPLTTDAADDLAPPMRLAPPRTIAVDLNDEGLGPLRVVATTEQRTVHLTVSAGEAIVRDALVRQQADLRNDLADAGLQLGSFEVDGRAADRDQTDQPAGTSDSDRDRPTARSAAGRVATTQTHDTQGADGRLDLRL